MKTIVATVWEWQELDKPWPESICRRVLDIVTMLDNEYGSARDIEADDVGYVCILANREDLASLKDVVDIEAANFEYSMAIDDNYHELLFLCNNEFGITVIIPTLALPEAWSDEV